MSETTLEQQRWAKLLQGMEAFLDRWQQITQQKLGADQLTAVYRLFAVWRQQNDLPLGSSLYGLRLGPLLCGDAEQQQLFTRLWQEYWPEETETKQRSSAPALKPEAAISPQTQGNWYDRPQKLLSKRYKKLALLLSLLVLLAAAAGLGYYYWPTKPTVISEQLVVPPPKTQSVAMKTEKVLPDVTDKPYLKIVPLRQPPPALTLNVQEKQQLDAALVWIMASALCFIVLVIGLIWWQRRVVFQSLSSMAQDQDQLHLKLTTQDPGGELIPGFSAVLARLRFAKIGLKKINWSKTIAATVRRGGFPELRYSDRHRQADFVLLSDCRHRHDQSAWLLGKLGETLRKAQVRVHAYDFDRHPEWLWPEGNRNRKPLQLEQILLQASR